MTHPDSVRYLIFDVESVADGRLISQVRYPGDELSPDEAIQRYRAELIETRGTDFIPYTFQIPAAVVVAKLDARCRLLDIASLDEPQFRPHVMTRHFWQGWEMYGQPTWVTFNGRSFDLPLMELAAFRYGIALPKWFNLEEKAYGQRRNRYNVQSHFDLQEMLTNFGASRFNGGLNLAANVLGKPGKMGVQGCMVQDLYNEQRHQEISDYCRCDVLDTYFVMLRTAVVRGQLSLDEEQQRVDETKQWIEAHRESSPAYRDYLSRWGDWHNPWKETPASP